jgi:hypothetical protein
VNCVSHTVVENRKQFDFKGDKSRVVLRTFWLIKVVPTWKKFEKCWFNRWVVKVCTLSGTVTVSLFICDKQFLVFYNKSEEWEEIKRGEWKNLQFGEQLSTWVLRSTPRHNSYNFLLWSKNSCAGSCMTPEYYAVRNDRIKMCIINCF